LSPEAVRLIQQLGAAEAISDSPNALYQRGAAIFPDGTRIERRHKHPGYVVPRMHLDHGLVKALRRAGAKVFEGQRVAQLSREGDRVSGVQGPNLRWSAPLTIATDGYASLAGRGARGISARGRQVAVSATAYFRGVSFPAGRDVSEHFFEHELSRGYAWIFPPVDGLSNVGVYMRADAYVEAGKKLPELLERFIALHPDRFCGAERVGEVRSWPLPLAPRADALSEAGLLLAGDAAGLVDPLSGEGIWQALASGLLAGSIAASALQCGELSHELQARYAQGCKQQFMRPSRVKLWVQDAIEIIVKRQLFRQPMVRTLLRWGWGHSMLDAQQGASPLRSI
jgi:flavin-dependent dehydrogenase